MWSWRAWTSFSELIMQVCRKRQSLDSNITKPDRSTFDAWPSPSSTGASLFAIFTGVAGVATTSRVDWGSIIAGRLCGERIAGVFMTGMWWSLMAKQLYISGVEQREEVMRYLLKKGSITKGSMHTPIPDYNKSKLYTRALSMKFAPTILDCRCGMPTTKADGLIYTVYLWPHMRSTLCLTSFQLFMPLAHWKIHTRIYYCYYS